jgi:cobalamin biosynthesis Mg chelatase CobN
MGKNDLLVARCTPEEKERAERVAQSYKMSVSELLRNLVHAAEGGFIAPVVTWRPVHPGQGGVRND